MPGKVSEQNTVKPELTGNAPNSSPKQVIAMVYYVAQLFWWQYTENNPGTFTNLNIML